MKRNLPRKDISYVSKRHLRRLRSQESELIYDSFFNTTVSSHSDNNEYSKYLNNDSTVNSHIIDKRKETHATENGTNNERNKNNISTVYENECQQLNKSDLEQSSVNISCDSISYVASENTNTTDNDFKDTLAVWTTEHQVSHTALRALLQILKQHSCFTKLSIDARSLLRTPRQQEIGTVTPGIYFWIKKICIKSINICKG